MKALRWTHSLKSRIVVSYSLILILGGVSTSMIGIYVTGQALMQQGRRQTNFGLSAAHATYTARLHALRQAVELLASSCRLDPALLTDSPATVRSYLDQVRQDHQFDFVSLTDSTGRVIVRMPGPDEPGDSATELAPVARALEGESAASTEIVPFDALRAIPPAVSTRGPVGPSPDPNTGGAANPPRSSQAGTIAMVAAAPIMSDADRVSAVVFAGRFLSRGATTPGSDPCHWLVDSIHGSLSQNDDTHEGLHSIVSIYLADVSITTCASGADDGRAIGSYASPDVVGYVLDEGKRWIGRTPVGDEWYITAYEPITNLAGERIGMLGVGLLEAPYTAVRNRVTLSFAAIAMFCFLLIVIVTYFLTRSLVRPLEEMASVSRAIAEGDLDQRVHVTGQSELTLLSSSFNDMLDRISQMKSQLEQLARTLEHKVEERTQQLVKVQEQAARQQRLASVGQLAAGVAHEINNPLGGILTFTSLILEELRPGDPHREDMEEVVRQAQRCRKIVSELLEFSRQRETQMTLASINDVIHRTLMLLERQAFFHDINVKRRFDATMPQTVMDESQMQQVFMNIILNAVDAMEGRGDLTIDTRHSKLKGELLLRFTDTGCGIPDEIKESIFDPFFTTKDPGKGTGLGLAVACRIVQAHGGRTEVESRIGKGTSFTIYLPISSDTLPGEE